MRLNCWLSAIKSGGLHTHQMNCVGIAALFIHGPPNLGDQMLSDSLTKLIISGWNSFTVNDLLKCMTHRPQQTLGVFPDDALTVLDCSHLHFLLSFFFLFVFILVLGKLNTYSAGLEVRWLGQSRTWHCLGPLLLWLYVKDHCPALDYELLLFQLSITLAQVSSVHNTLIQDCNLAFLRFASCGEPVEVILV